jgi:dipeptidyl aminopeptidase/acylaminoacyl peptidase
MQASRQSCVFLLALLYVSAVAAQTTAPEPKRFALDDAAKIVRLSDPQISPDGQAIVIVVARANYKDNRWDNELVLVEVATGAQRVLTYERHDVKQPRWSPSGDRLAFIAAALTDKEQKPQIFVLPMNGGEAKRLTSAPNGVQHYAWKPDGHEIAFVTADDSPNKKIGNREIAFEVGNDHFLTTAAATPSHIWLTALNGDKARRLTSGAWSLAVTLPPGAPAPALSWSPDGNSIAFVKQATPHSGDSDQRSVQILEVASGAIRGLTGTTTWESQPVFSPDGLHIAYWYPRDGVRGSANEINVTSAAGGAGIPVTRTLDRNVFRSLWMPDSRSLLTGGNDGTRAVLWLQPLEGPAHRLELGMINPTGLFDVSVNKDGAIAFTGSTPQRPVELYYLSSPQASPKQLSDFNGAIAALELGKVEKVEWTHDGYHMDGVLTFPPDFAPGRSYPLVVYIHGGPRGASREMFNERVQLMAMHGWVVFEPNYRGSDNLGNTFQYAIVHDTGDGPGRDIMAGIEMLQTRGFVDPSRMAVSGWSYGGFMTTWLIGHYHVWKAAVAGASVTDWTDTYNLADWNVLTSHELGGSPWTGDAEKAYRAQSPITYAPQSKTPTLILADTGDVRVPITQSYKLYHALHDNNVPVQFIAYPVAGHAPLDPVRQQDVNRRWIEWLEKYLHQPVTSQKQ